MEITRSYKRLYVNKKRYISDLLQETGITYENPTKAPMKVNKKMSSGKVEEITEIRSFQCLITKLIYLSTT